MALEDAASKLGPFLDEVVFTGGAIVGILANDPAGAPIRPTIDIDVIVEVAGYAEYLLLSERLRVAGFTEDTRDDAPICRWVNGELTLDVMPMAHAVLGFTNSWFAPSMSQSQTVMLESGASIRIVSAPYFLSSKLEAYRSRGAGDCFASHDLEDFIAVVDGDPNILEELASAASGVKHFLAREVQALLGDERFMDALPGFLAPDALGQSRVPLLLENLRVIAHL
jgi:hypothetical protein